jgi:ABC-type nitrate/sulfonate/bicarbonate transport system permease component
MKKLFDIGGKLPDRTVRMIEIFGFIFFLALWYVITIPQENLSVQFASNNPSGISYSWKGPGGFSQEMKGDNILLKLKPGKYTFTAKDSSGLGITDAVEVPAQIKETVRKEFSKKLGKDSIQLHIEIKSVKDGWVSKAVLPPPIAVIKSFKELHFKDQVVRETGYSVGLNILGYLEAILISILLGFTIGLVPFFRALLNKFFNSTRFIPLTAVTGLFIAWFGIDSNMKVQFLAFGIFVYLLPVVIQRIDEVLDIYLQTAYTLGASKWQQIRTVYFPSVASRIIDDIRVLTAISWTYIIIAEMMNQTGGIGSLIHLSGRQSRLDKVFALLIVIVIIGIIQDRLFAWLDKKIFSFKYQGKIL